MSTRPLPQILAVSLLSLFVFGCAEEEEEEESTSQASLSCPSPVKDRDGFIACVQNKTSGSSSSSSTSTGKGGTASSSQSGGTITIGGGSSSPGGGRCSSLSVSCKSVNGQNVCTCRGNGGPEQSCDGSNCQQVCCP